MLLEVEAKGAGSPRGVWRTYPALVAQSEQDANIGHELRVKDSVGCSIE